MSKTLKTVLIIVGIVLVLAAMLVTPYNTMWRVLINVVWT